MGRFHEESRETQWNAFPAFVTKSKLNLNACLQYKFIIPYFEI